MIYFGITKDNYSEVARDIFIKSIYTLTTLDKVCIKNDEIEEELNTDQKA